VRFFGCPANHGDSCYISQWQDAIVFEQDHPFASDFARQGMMGSGIELPPLCCFRRLENNSQNTTQLVD
jgi:hypothetical protein